MPFRVWFEGDQSGYVVKPDLLEALRQLPPGSAGMIGHVAAWEIERLQAELVKVRVEADEAIKAAATRMMDIEAENDGLRLTITKLRDMMLRLATKPKPYPAANLSD